MKEYTGYYKSSIGVVRVKGNDEGILFVDFIDDEQKKDERLNPIITDCINQLDEYFSGKRKEFNIKLSLEGTEFQKNVWQALLEIPFGETKSYKDIAVRINNEKAVRAVGGANHNNKISIIVPCHRVIGKSGKMVGYGGGLWRKEWLLEHERIYKHEGR